MSRAGKKLTDLEKAQRAVKADVRKQVAELGPLFADQAIVPDVEDVLMGRRQRWAGMAADLCEHLLCKDTLDVIEAMRLRRMAQACIPAEAFAELDAHKRIFPRDYEGGFWAGILTGSKRVEIRGHKVLDSAIKPHGFRIEYEFVWPPPGWTPPFTRETLGRHWWSDCRECGMSHAPNQSECIPQAPCESARLVVKDGIWTVE